MPIEVKGRFVHDRYRGVRMPPPEAVLDADERQSMYYDQKVSVYNVRELNPAPRLSTHGFTLVEHATSCSDMANQELVTTVLYAEYARILQDLTGCTKVKVTQHQYRNGYGGLPAGHPRAARPTPNGSEGVYGGIHSDVTAYSEPGWGPLVEDRHFQVFNFWQSSNPSRPIRVMPLSLCDMTSVEPLDMVYADSWNQTRHRRKLVSYRLTFNASQRWFYYPDMKPNELLVFKQYDSMEEAPNRRCVYHGAIDLPDEEEDLPLRETIEVRLLALFDKEQDKKERVRRFQAQIPSNLPDGTTSAWLVKNP